MAAKRYRTNADYIDFAARAIRAAGRRVGQTDPEDLALLIGLQDTLSAAIQEAVNGQRADGMTWASIGEATGTTKQAAIQKWANRSNDGEG